MFRKLSYAACAFAVGLKNKVDLPDSPLLSDNSVSKLNLQRCLMPRVSAGTGDCQLYVGDRIKRAVGFPQLTACCKPLRYKDFIISYDTKNRIPNWVYEHLQYHKFYKDDPCDRRVNVCPYNEDNQTGQEKPKFHPDCRIHGYHRADVRDYCDTEYELGLMADPANYPFDSEACAETQVMTNVVPIVPGFSCGPWFDLQCYIREKLVRENKSVYVCSGPLFLPSENDGKVQMRFDVLGEGEVSVPSHFFK
ncbi:endonuclease G mitochondrial, partial [Biomphalaria glabrata]